ncbi:scopoletin glucosyltransferase-like [Cornus florida]|uniref:scopoletin glucosyltransferase-like n=1 Tax=Cornus florida TaxID=4283 RepID=UPI0028994166|nr:scopoletin glucosyltransferase-like [Cornus florida]
MGQLHVFFFPFMAHGHMLPTMDMAKLFASHCVKTTIITTPLNAPIFTKAIQRTKNLSTLISISVIKFPAEEAGLPQGCENIDQIHSEDMAPNFFKAINMLQEPLEHVIEVGRPDCLVADMFFPWATDVAAKFSIPRIVFHGISFFALCAGENMRLYKPQKNVSSDSKPFIVPNLPHEVKITKMRLADFDKEDIETDFSKFLDKARETEMTSFGVVVNSFYELEPAYADHYRRVLGRKAWHIGPVSLCNREVEDKAQRGKETSIDKLECLKWLDSKKPNSVIYACFGSCADFATSQLYEIAMGLEASGQEFIWVVRKAEIEDDNENWLPEGFEERTKGKGLIIRGWAPQVLILDHDAVGGFVTHCGWNSTLEGVSAGVPMVTAPFFADQFFNEKLVTEILKIGVCVGSQQWKRVAIDGVKREAIEKAVKEIMAGEEAEERRRRARTLKEMAWKAVEEGGSSYTDLNALIKEVSAYQAQKHIKT